MLEAGCCDNDDRDPSLRPDTTEVSSRARPDWTTLSPQTTVFIVDDHPEFRAVAAAMVDATEGFRFVGSADSASGALDELLNAETPPDLVLMDINLGDGNGVEVARRLIEQKPSIRVVFVSTLERDELPDAVDTVGAAAYLPKRTLSPLALEEVNTKTYDWRL